VFILVKLDIETVDKNAPEIKMIQ